MKWLLGLRSSAKTAAANHIIVKIIGTLNIVQSPKLRAKPKPGLVVMAGPCCLYGLDIFYRILTAG